MKKQKALLISLMIIILVIVSAPNRSDSADKTINSEPKTNVVHNIQEVEKATNKQEPPGGDSYSVKEYRGFIAVFKKGSEKPLRTTEISVKTLPEADQKILKNGIFAENSEQLNEILEDYLS